MNQVSLSPPTSIQVETRTDTVGSSGWHIRDEVFRLRERGTNTVHPLPLTRRTSIIGAAEGCWLRLRDPKGRISRNHAKLRYSKYAGWTISDMSKNGVHLDNVRVKSLAAVLVPGIEIRIGSVTLIAESPMFCALRELLARFIGWSDDYCEEVDQALYSVRIAATHREPLLICGPGNLVSIARLLHRHALGDQPFVVCDPAIHASGMAALAAAAGGTLCVRRDEQPADLNEVVTAVRTPPSRVLLVICAPALPRGKDLASQIVTVFRSIVLPPMADRARELYRIIDAYATDAITTFGGWLAPADRDWIARHESDTLADIEKATCRIIALHACNERVTPAAELLSMSHGTLSGWVAPRALPGRSPRRSQMPAIDEDEK